MNRSDPTQFSF